MSHDYARLNKMVRRHKKKGPKAVIAACDAAFAEFDEPGNIWPDNWHLWNVAKQDAEYQLRREEHGS